jgi:hypothetical protein
MSYATERRTVPRFPRVLVGSDGSVIGPSGRVLKTFSNSGGYRRVTIYLGGGRWRQVSVHTLVAEAFLGERPAWADGVAHADGDPANNAVSNLRWATQAENEADKARHGRNMAGVRHHQHKLTEEQAREIKDSAETGRVLARRFGISETQISDIRNGKAWRHLS